MNSLPGLKIWYSVAIYIDSIWNWPNSLWQTKYCSYLQLAQREKMAGWKKNQLKIVLRHLENVCPQLLVSSSPVACNIKVLR